MKAPNVLKNKPVFQGNETMRDLKSGQVQDVCIAT